MMKTHSKISLFIGLLRPKTLFSSLSSVIVAISYSLFINHGSINWNKAILLILIGILAQIASNIANDLFDFKKGSDTAYRKGPLRPLSKGLLSIKQVKTALILTIALLLIVSSIIIINTTPYLIILGIIILLGIFAYSGGPYPLSRNGYGEVAVIIFFGLIPTITSFYILTNRIWDITIWNISLAIGLSSANILVVNNYRDYNEDLKAGKRTLLVKLGRDVGSILYLTFGMLSMLLLYPIYSFWGMILLIPYAFIFVKSHEALQNNEGEQLNIVLASTARNTLLLAILITIMLIMKVYLS